MNSDMPFQSKNPATGKEGKTYSAHDAAEVERRLARAQTAYESWRGVPFAKRAALMRTLADLFDSRSKELAVIAAEEMGKPIVAGIAEAEKCAWALRYYADNAEAFLTPEIVETDYTKSYVRFDPIGPVLAVMPWNFPYWQVIRFAAPALMAGNVGLLKHASNVQGAARAMEELFLEAGFPEGAFQNLAISVPAVEGILRDDRVRGVALTGSERAGGAVAAIAGSEIKTSVLELGGSDPFVVLADADVKAAAEAATTARLQNTGQSCIAAKRFIVEQPAVDEFISLLKKHFETMIVGDPLDEETQIGPMSSEQGMKDIVSQIERSVALGADVVTGGTGRKGNGHFCEPTILANVTADMPVYREETFGPVAAVIVAKDTADAVRIANDTRFGLGASVWTKDIEKAEAVAASLDAGFVAINGIVKSDPRLPFGGTKKSGYGRELSRYGLLEFVNVKTVTVSV